MQPLTTMLLRLADQLDAFSESVGRATSWMTLGMVLITFAVVVLRYAFDIGWIAMQELINYLHASVFLLGAGYTLKHGEHVRVDIFYSTASTKTRAIIDLFGALFLLIPVCCFIAWVSWEYVMASWDLHEGSREAGGLPGVFLLKSTLLLMSALLILQGIGQAVRALAAVRCNN